MSIDYGIADGKGQNRDLSDLYTVMTTPFKCTCPIFSGTTALSDEDELNGVSDVRTSPEQSSFPFSSRFGTYRSRLQISSSYRFTTEAVIKLRTSSSTILTRNHPY